MWFNRKAQAATEFAVLGSLIIVAFAFLISYSEKLNRQQASIQQTFRAALKEAQAANSSASYTKVDFRRMPNVGSPMELGQLQTFSSSANVLWADGNLPTYSGTSNDGGLIVRLVLGDGTIKFLFRTDSSGMTYTDDNGDIWGKNSKGTYSPQEVRGVSKYQLNDDVKTIPYRVTPAENTEDESGSIFTNDSGATTTFVKEESQDKIKTTKTLDAQDTLTADVKINKDQQYHFEQSLGKDGKYYIGGTETLKRSRKME